MMETEEKKTKEELCLLTDADFADCVDEMLQPPPSDGAPPPAYGRGGGGPAYAAAPTS